MAASAPTSPASVSPAAPEGRAAPGTDHGPLRLAPSPPVSDGSLRPPKPPFWNVRNFQVPPQAADYASAPCRRWAWCPRRRGRGLTRPSVPSQAGGDRREHGAGSGL